MKDMVPKGNRPRVLLATGIFFPDVGGPATHVRRIAEHFHKLGWRVTVIAFGDHPNGEPYRVIRIRRQGAKPLSWARYASAIFRESLRHDLVYAFDLTTAGVPSALSARIARKPFLLRIGGDPIWERAVEKGKRFLPMRRYYEQALFRQDRPWLYRIIRFVVGSADRVVTYGEFLRKIYVSYYGVSEDAVLIFKNPFSKGPSAPLEQGTFTYMFAGRFVSYKNLPRVLRAFERVSARHPQARLLLVGGGPDEAVIRDLAKPFGERVRIAPSLDQDSLFKAVNAASVALAPALTEFNPNFILEALSLGKPALISRDNGLSVSLPGELQFDPMSDVSVEDAMERIIDPDGYRKALATVESLPAGETWDTLVARHAELVSSFLPL